jgi:hypothetical protein
MPFLPRRRKGIPTNTYSQLREETAQVGADWNSLSLHWCGLRLGGLAKR